LLSALEFRDGVRVIELTIRAASRDEVEQILLLWQVAGENVDRPVDRREAVAQLLDRDPRSLLVAVEGEQLVGTLIAGWDGWRAHLYRLAVLPEYRRRGIARSLLEAAAERLTTLGASRLDAMVVDSNEDGQRLWGAAGYSPQPNWRRWVQHVT
jgi:ribosomal protein S18 acetylase RimI-like enzyme